MSNGEIFWAKTKVLRRTNKSQFNKRTGSNLKITQNDINALCIYNYKSTKWLTIFKTLGILYFNFSKYFDFLYNTIDLV